MKKLLLVSTLLILSVASFATTYYNKASGTAALEVPANWGTNVDGSGTAPSGFVTTSDIFNLSNGTSGTISSPWVITGVTLNVTGVFNLTIPAAFSLTGTGVVAVAAGGTLTLQNATNPTLGTLNATSTVNYNGTGAQTIAAATYGNLSLSGTRTGTPAISLGPGTTSTINVAGNFNVTYTGAVTFVTTGNTFNYSKLTGGCTIGGITYNILKQSNTSGTNTAGGNIVAQGTFTTTTGGTLDMGNLYTLAVTGAVSNSGTIKTGVLTTTSALPIPAGKSIKGTVIYTSLTGGQTIVSEIYYYGLQLLNTSGTNTAGGTFTIRAAFVTSPGGTLDMTSAYRMAIGTGYSLTNNGTITTSVLSTTSTSPLPSGVAWGGTGTIIYASATGGQSVMKGTYGCALTLANTSGTNTATGIITMNNTLTTTSGGIFSMSTYALNGTTPAVVNNGTISTAAVANPAVPAGLNWTGTTGNMIFAATAGLQFVPAGTYGTLKFSNTSGTNTAVGNLTVNTSLITTTGTGILALSTNQLLGGFTPTNNGTISTLSTASPCIPAGLNWTGTTGSIVFAALTGGQFIPQGTYKKLTFSNTSGTVAATGDIALSAGVLTTTAGGTLDMGTNVLSGTTTFTNAGTILTSSTSSNPLPAGITWAGTINYAATTGGQTVVAGTYNNLTLSNTSGTNTAGGNIVVNTGTMTTTAGGTLDMGTTGILSGSATFTNNGNIITSVPSVTSATPIPAGKAWGGTITYGATAGSQTIVSETSYNNLVLNNASGSNTSAGNQVVNGTLTTAGGTEDMGAFTLGGTLASITGGGTIRTANTSATPIATGKAWTQAIEYYTAAGGQTIVSGTYSGGLTNSNTSGTNTVVAAGAVSVPGDLTLTAGSTLADNGVTISVAGDIAGTGTHSGAGAISMTGSGATISGVTMGNLTLNNAGGFSTNDDATINGTLTLTAGKLNIGTNVLNFGASAPAVAGTPSVTKMIVATGGGQVRKLFSSNGSFLYPIGDASNYTPITLNFTGGTYAGGAYGGVTVTPSKQPQNANTTNFLKRYWSVATSGITSPVYQVTAATYAAADVTGTEGSMVLGAYNALPWIQPAGSTVNTGTHTLAATGTLTNTTVDITGVSGVHGTVVVTSPSSSVFCSGATHQMDATPTGDPAFTYSWAPATGLSATTGATVIATPTVTGTVATVFTYTVTMTDGNGLTATGTHAVTVNPLPVISGINATCLASTTTLGTNISGTWTSSNSSIASVGSATGIVSGVALGNATITITAASTSCVSTVLVSVNATPSAILGATSVCSGSITTLGEAVSGGNWSSADPSLATVDAFGNVTGVASGTVNISYISGAGCFVTQPMTVGPLLPITGVLAACTGQNTTLNDASAGGTWSSGNMTIAIVGSSSGIVTGVSTGSVPITYTIGSGCFRTVNIAVNLAPTPITGSAAVCNGQTTTLSEAVPGGIWSSSNSAIASVGSTGVVSGVAVGNATITYMSGANCYATANATVNALPASITGTTSVCAGGSNTTLADATPSGTWSSSNSNATVGSSTGIVTGVTAGSSTITYTISTGCINTTPVTINALPAAITGTMTACAGLSSTLSDATGGGSWSSSNSGLATVGSSTGSVTGVASGNPVISYILSATGCASTTVFTVNPLPAAISGTTAVCIGLTTTLTDAGGGTWTSSNGNATIGSATGVVTGVSAGNSTITYTLPTTCRITTPVTVNSLPASIGGTAVACVAQSTTLTDGTPSGTWSSSNTGLATIGSSTGTVIGVAAGNPVITYMLVTGCIATKVATINALPGAISGTTTLCNGETSTLTDGTPSGTWSSSDVTNATIGSTSGIVNTVSSGPAIISYTLPTGCAATTTVSVNDVPSPIAGTTDVCIGSSATLTDPDGGGKWSSSNTSVATIGSSSGIINGLSVGTTMITYTFTASGCYISEGVNVNAYPGAITGNLIVCVGSVTDLDNTVGGGDWTSSATSKVTVDIVDGNATGVAAGTSTISYTLPTGCGVASIVTVTAMPALGSTTNTGPICAGGTLTLNANTATNVTAYAWSGPVAITSSTSAAATVPSATAGAAGVYSVTVTNGTGVGCARTYTTTAVVNTTPTAAPTNSGAICNGGTVTLNANPAGGATLYAWSGSNLSSSSVQNPTATPTVTTTYSVTVSKAGGSGCAPATVYTTIVTVNPTPAVSGGSMLPSVRAILPRSMLQVHLLTHGRQLQRLLRLPVPALQHHLHLLLPTL